MAYGSGNISKAICDRCGFEFNYLQLQQEADTKLQVCSDCLDQPDPYRRRRTPTVNISLRYPRPDVPLTYPNLLTVGGDPLLLIDGSTLIVLEAA